MGVAEAAIAAACEADALADLGQIGKQNLAVLVENLGSGGHFQNRVGALAARRGSCPCRACRWPP